MSVSAVEVYEKLKPHLGEEETKALISYIEYLGRWGERGLLMLVSTVEVYEKLKPRWGEEDTKLFLTYLEERVREGYRGKRGSHGSAGGVKREMEKEHNELREGKL